MSTARIRQRLIAFKVGLAEEQLGGESREVLMKAFAEQMVKQEVQGK